MGIFAENVIGKSSLEKESRTPPADKREITFQKEQKGMTQSGRNLGELEASQAGPGKGEVTGRPKYGRGRRKHRGDTWAPGLASDSFPSVKLVSYPGAMLKKWKFAILDIIIWMCPFGIPDMCIPMNTANLLFTFSER